MNLDPGGYCCIPSYAYTEGGVCAPDTYQSFIGGVEANKADKITEGNCLSGPEKYSYDKGILWNDDSKLCAFFCGQETELSYCDPRGTAVVNAYTCVEEPVARQTGDPSTIGFGYRYARNSDIPSSAPAGTTSCEAICVPPADVETTVRCPQACVNGDYVCEITVRNKDGTHPAHVTAIKATLDWDDLNDTITTFNASRTTGAVYDANDEEVNEVEADPFESRTLRWPARESLYGAPPTLPIEIPAGGSFSASVTLTAQAGQQGAQGTTNEGRVSAYADAPGDPDTLNNSDFAYLTVSESCGFEGTSECTQGAQPSPYVEYVVTVPEGSGTARVTIPVPDCLDIDDLNGVNVDGPWMSKAIARPAAGGNTTTVGCWFSGDEADADAGIAGMVHCNVLMNASGPELAWYQAWALTDEPECASGQPINSIAATIQLPGQRGPASTDPATVIIATCGMCDLCAKCMTPDGRACEGTDDDSGRETCETDPRYSAYCRWIPPDLVYRKGQPVSTPGRCAPDPDAFDDENENEIHDDDEPYSCDYSYGCCQLIAGPTVRPGDEITEENGIWYYLFGFVEKGRETQEFAAAKQCVLDADDPDADIYYATDWARAPVEDAAGELYFPAQRAADTDDEVNKRRAACEEDYNSSSSSASTSPKPRTPGSEHLYCDRRLLGLAAAGGITSRQAVWVRDAGSAKQSARDGTVLFNKPFYSEYNPANGKMGPLDSEGVSPLKYTIGDPNDPDSQEAEPFCATAKNIGVCCRPYKANEESCPIMVAEVCDPQGMILPFEQEHSDTCVAWETTCWDKDDNIVDCDQPGAVSTCEANVPVAAGGGAAGGPLRPAPGLQNPNP